MSFNPYLHAPNHPHHHQSNLNYGAQPIHHPAHSIIHPSPPLPPIPAPLPRPHYQLHNAQYPPPQQRALLVDPPSNIQQTVHHHNNVVNINNISMHRLQPPHKKRKLTHNSYIETSREQPYNQQIHELKQKLDRSLTRNKEHEARIQQMNKETQQSINLAQILEMERKKERQTINCLSNTIKQLRTNIDAMKSNEVTLNKGINDQLFIINDKQSEICALKKRLKEKQDILDKKDDEIEDLKSKYKKMKGITANLYLECVNGEEPRWELIEIKKTNNGIIRDKSLHSLHQNIRDSYPNDGTYKVCGVGKWKKNKEIELCVKEYLQLNGEYTHKSMVILKDIQLNKHMVKKRNEVIQKFAIITCHRIPALNGQFGIRALIDIPKYTVCGQYFGGELSVEAFAKVFDGTAVEHEHNVYALDQEIDEQEIKTLIKKSKNKMDVNDTTLKYFVIDPFIVDDEESVLLPFINDCRANINNMEPTDEDRSYFNVEFVGVKINGWTQTYLITKRDIKKGEELQTYYGDVFGVAVRNKMQNEEAKQTKKIRIDRDILQQLKHEFQSIQSTFRLCKYV